MSIDSLHSATPDSGPISHEPEEEELLFDPSFAQESLWFLDQLEAHQSTYHILLALKLEGLLQVPALYSSLHSIIERHEALRTTFVAIEGRPMQSIALKNDSVLTCIDLSHLEEDARTCEMQRLIPQVVELPFDLRTGPLLRTWLLLLNAEEYILVVTCHHIVMDGWSSELFLGELKTHYNACVTGERAVLPELPVQYADYAAWQREMLQDDTLEELTAYWQQRLAGAPAVLELPTDHPRPAILSHRGGRIQFQLPASLSEALQVLSRREGATLFMTLLAAFQILLMRYSGQTDVVVGTPIANRTRVELANLIGHFANMLVLRTDLSGTQTFQDVLRQVRAVCLEAYDYQDLPFDYLVEVLRPERSLSYNPLFQISFGLQNFAVQPLHFTDLSVESLDVTPGIAHFDLSCDFLQMPEGLLGRLEYSTDLFEVATIERMAEHYVTLLESIVADPAQSSTTLPLLTSSERQQILVEWNDTHSDTPHDQCLHALFEAQVELVPEAIALLYADQHVTYRELDARANQLAHYLQSLGVGADVAVGLCCERAPEMIVGLLGILKAGGVYVPLDPGYPAQRLAFLIADTHLPVLLTQDRLREHLPAFQGALLCLDSGWSEIAHSPATRLPGTVTPEQLAYIIYTSGSTGMPKGVAMSHAALVNLCTWQHRTSAHPAGTRTLQFASLSFDVASQEIFCTLGSGQTVVLLSEEMRSDPARLLSFINAEAIGRLFLPVVALHQLAEVAAFARKIPATLREVIIAGEQLQMTAQVVRLFERLPNCRLVNQYGPSESHVVSAYVLAHSPQSWPMAPPIGRPIANTKLYVLDSLMQPVPVGVVGELHIGGRALARGYLHRPELTAERFVPSPFGSQAATRLYKSGDLGRYLPDGTIEFVGRVDSQVKIRGYRIELGEIEVALREQSHVKEVVVVARGEPGESQGERRLVAYVVPTTAEALTSQQLREALHARLPSYMVPSIFVLLPALPVNSNGKVDRHALPAPRRSDISQEERYEVPRTLAESQMARIWQEVLHLEQVGVRDNFFSLGGHSLLATRLIARIRNAFGVELPLRSVFTMPTIADLTQQIEEIRRTSQGIQLPPIFHTDLMGHVPLSYAQQRLWFLDQWEPESPFYTIPVTLSLTGQLNYAALEQSFNEIVQRHQSLRTTFVMYEGYPVQVIAPSLTVVLPVVDLRGLPEGERVACSRAFCAEGIRYPFDLSRGPLLRAFLLRLNEAEHVLLLTLHHIVSDGWSMDVLFHDLELLYGAFAAGKSSPLSDLPIQYADFALWQRQWLQGEMLEQHLDAWKAQLAGVPVVLELPTDHPRPGVQSTRGAHHAFAFPSDLTRQMKVLSRQEGVTLFMLLLAAFQVLLLRYSGQKDIVVGTPIANRTRAELEDLIGCFINMLVLRTDLSGNPSFCELLSRVREVALHAYAHQDLPFEQLVEAIQPERSLSHSPLFQVMFVWQDSSEQAWKLPGLTLHPLQIESGTAKFDLTLFLWEQADHIEGVLEYNTDLFEAPTIERLLAHYEHLLESAVAQPWQPLASLQLFSEAEREQMLVHWNNSGYGQSEFDIPFINDASASSSAHMHSQIAPGIAPGTSLALSLAECFAEQVTRTPDAVALACVEEQWTYQQLDVQARRMAHYLRLQGIGPDSLVAILAERGVLLVTTMLAVFNVGGTYLPLDPQHPQARQREILSHSRVRLVLATAIQEDMLEQALHEMLPGSRPQVLQIEALITQETRETSDKITGMVESKAALCLPANERNLAYVIYTSGSTGQPKGVMIEQGGMLNHLAAKIDDLHLTEKDTVAQTASQCFDISVWQMLAALCVGGRVQVLPDEVAHDPRRLLLEMDQRGVTILETVPSLLHALLEEVERMEEHRPALTMLRWLMPTGEALPPELCRRWLRFYPHVPLMNAYGPTECSDDVTHEPVVQPPPVWVSYTPIGRPVSNIRLYVLDRWLGVAPSGAYGELYVGGRGVGRGYLYDAAKTAEAFVPDSLSGEEGARLYKTGDVVRYLADGRLEYRGRVDHQVKLRGYRIELGEIEAALYRDPLIREAVVMVREDSGSNRRLVAYVVPQERVTGSEEHAMLADDVPVLAPAETLSGTRLRRHLQECLPAYMVPATFVLLESLPRTSNGKLDRRALPAVSLSRDIVEGEEATEEPRTPIEEQLAQIWIQVLRVPHIGVHDNFFEVGGHSVLATQLIARVRDTLQVELLLRSVFEAPTIAALAEIIAQRQSRSEDKHLDMIQRVVQGSEEELLLENIQQLSDEEMEALLDAALAEEEIDG